MSDWRATPQDIAAAANSCNTTAEEIAAQLLSLKAYVQDLQTRWLGMASQTFGALMADYDVYSRMLHDALVDIGSGLQGNFVNYVDSEAENVRNLVTVNGAIPGQPTGGSLPPARL
jgi:WXG100 family type VII secretion target